MKIKHLLIISSLLFSFNSVFAQVSTTEKLTYAANYSMSGLMTHLGQVTVQTEIINTAKNSYLRSSWEIATFSKWDGFFKMRDLYECYMNPKTLKPSLYKRNIFEGGYTKKEKYLYSSNKRSISSISQTKKKPEKDNHFNIGVASQDVVASIAKLRTIDFSKFAIGQTTGFTIVFDEKEFPVVVKYMGKETISAGNLGKKECYKLSIAARTKVLKGKDKNQIWITADSRRIPALIRFSIPVGVGEIALISAQ
jgi:hypothetical protein